MVRGNRTTLPCTQKSLQASLANVWQLHRRTFAAAEIYCDLYLSHELENLHYVHVQWLYIALADQNKSECGSRNLPHTLLVALSIFAMACAYSDEASLTLVQLLETDAKYTIVCV